MLLLPDLLPLVCANAASPNTTEIKSKDTETSATVAAHLLFLHEANDEE